MKNSIRPLRVKVAQRMPSQISLMIIFFVLVICVISISWYKAVRHRTELLQTAYINNVSADSSEILDNTDIETPVNEMVSDYKPSPIPVTVATNSMPQPLITKSEESPVAGIEKRIVHIHGTVEHSFIHSLIKAGASEKAVLQLTKFLSQQINFSRDFHPGDKFNIIYTAYFLNNKRLPSGNILAAQINLQNGKKLTALRFTDTKGKTQYYKPNSASFHPGFMRYPLHFSHISSGFSHGRFHPLLHIYRPHLGIDLAAPFGTPVEAVGEGKIAFIGRHGGYGKAVIVNHGHGYTSLYAHLSNYQRGLHVGSNVREGQTIGFVGSTGLATGPHCHYEFRLNGTHFDPSHVKLPGNMPLTDPDRYAFLSQAKILMTELNETSDDVIIAGHEHAELTKIARIDETQYTQ